MSLSAHLVDNYDKKPIIPPYPPSRPAGPSRPSFMDRSVGFGDRTMDGDTSWMSSHGGPSRYDFQPPSSAGGFTRWSEEKVASLQVRLARKLGPEYVTQRPGPGGGPKLSYIEGWKVINLANEVFGFNGWSSSIMSLTTDFIDVAEGGRVTLNVTAIVRITLADGCWHEDVGCGQAENQRGKGQALDKAKKEAVTDATKRALRTFGNVLGNCMYDREYTKEVVKIKVPPPKFERAELERRPEFADPSAPGPSRPAAIPQHMANLSRPPIGQTVPWQADGTERPPTPLKSVYETTDDDMFIDENFDGEFVAMADETMISVDQSAQIADVRAEKPAQTGMSAPVGISGYQHRYRPETAPQRPITNTGPTGAAARQAFLRSEQTKMPETPQSAKGNGTVIYETPVQAGGSSGSSETIPDIPPRKPVGGFTVPEARNPPAMSAQAAAQARRQAILGNTIARPESPKIPSGGIDAVAQKATTNFAASARALGLEEQINSENASGFTSARGMKRTISTGDGSPTKAKSVGPPILGPRRVLGELPQETGGEDWAAKRQRAG